MIHMLGLPLLMCLALAAILGYLGMHVLKREVIFVDIALAQLAAVGAIAAHLAFDAHTDSLLSFLVPCSCSTRDLTRTIPRDLVEFRYVLSGSPMPLSWM